MRSWMIAYLAGVLLFHLWGDIIPIPFLMAALGFSVLSFVLLRRFSWIVVLIIAVAWSSLYSGINKNKVIDEAFESTDLVATGYVCSIPKNKGSFIGFELCNVSVYIKEMPERRAEGLRLKLNWYTKDNIRLQGVNTFDIRIKKPHGMVNPSGFLYEKWLFRKGIHGVGYVKTIKRVQRGADEYYCNNFSLLCYLTAFRIQINEHLSVYENDLVFMPVIKALSIGYRGDIPDEPWALLKNTGTQHLIAISGLHIGLVYGGVFVFFSQYKVDQNSPTRGHSVNHDTDPQPSSSTLCGGGTPKRTARHDNATHGKGRENQDAVLGAAASHSGTIKEDVENNKDGGGLKLVDPQQPKDMLGSKTEESLAASDRLASPILKPLDTGDLQDTNAMTYEIQLEPRKLYTNQSTAPLPLQSQAGGLLRKKHHHLGQKSFSLDRKNGIGRSKSSPPDEYNVPVNLPPLGSPSILYPYSSEPSMYVCSLSHFHHQLVVY